MVVNHVCVGVEAFWPEMTFRDADKNSITFSMSPTPQLFIVHQYLRNVGVGKKRTFKTLLHRSSQLYIFKLIIQFLNLKKILNSEFCLIFLLLTVFCYQHHTVFTHATAGKHAFWNFRLRITTFFKRCHKLVQWNIDRLFNVHKTYMFHFY